MGRWQRTALVAGILGMAGTLYMRFVWFRRLAFPEPCHLVTCTDHAGNALALAHLPARQVPPGRPRLVILAHGLMKSMQHHNMVRLAELLRARFDVLTFDFAGHGHSTGLAELSYSRAGDSLRCVLAQARALGYRRIGVIGYSLGAAAALLTASQGAGWDAVVSVCCPGDYPRQLLGCDRWVTWPWSWWARLMGMRAAPLWRLEPWPIAYVARVAPTPLLVVHHGLDTLVRRAESEALFAAAQAPKDYLYVPYALHDSPLASASPIIDWLDKAL
jgi:pimeloyl-ACP methyl ester carboxylesterase